MSLDLLQLFPYHLGEYVCRQMRLSPFRYYTSILVDSMKEDAPYDSIPNFTVSAQAFPLPWCQQFCPLLCSAPLIFMP